MTCPYQFLKVRDLYQHLYPKGLVCGNSSKLLNKKMVLKVLGLQYMLFLKIYSMEIVAKRPYQNFIRKARLDSNYTKMKTIWPKSIFKDNYFKITGFVILILT